jgi:hypothetical protein
LGRLSVSLRSTPKFARGLRNNYCEFLDFYRRFAGNVVLGAIVECVALRLWCPAWGGALGWDL